MVTCSTPHRVDHCKGASPRTRRLCFLCDHYPQAPGLVAVGGFFAAISRLEFLPIQRTLARQRADPVFSRVCESGLREGFLYGLVLAATPLLRPLERTAPDAALITPGLCLGCLIVAAHEIDRVARTHHGLANICYPASRAGRERPANWSFDLATQLTEPPETSDPR